MKKLLIGAIVGGIIIFAWQTLSYTVLNLHAKGMEHTDKQDAILSYLNTEGLQPGSYLLPLPPPGTSMSEGQDFMKNYEGKPWAVISYHESWDLNMGMNMIRGLLSNMIMVFFLCWILGKITQGGYSTYFTATVLVGLIAFINEPYTGHIWYPMYDIGAFLIDSLVAWGLCGFWLGWWYSRKKG